jgi:hypothetical protein
MKIDMTQDEIIEMAKQANAIPIHKDFNQLALIGTENIERFAKLVAQHEREACAKFIEHDYVRQFERPWRDDLSAAIRARGETK